MHDRGMIKWMPFNSVVNSKYLIKSIENEKRKINKPVLSDEQIETIENKITEAYINKIPVILNIYHEGYINNIKGNITNINSVNKKIELDKTKWIYFCQIVNINFITL